MTDQPQAAQEVPQPKRQFLKRLDEMALHLTAWWETQHFLKLFVGGIVLVTATIGVPTTVLSMWQYYSEAPQREADRAIKRLEVLNSAWERIEDTRNKIGDFGQIGAIAILLGDNKSALKNATLSGIDLSQADFSGADLSETNFGDGRTVSAKFAGATIRKTTFRGTRLADVDLSLVVHLDPKLDFSTSRLRNVVLPRLPLEPILDIRRATVASIDLGGFKHGSIIADGACVVALNLDDYRAGALGTENLSARHKLSFRNARLAGVSLRNADLNGGDFREATFTGAVKLGTWHFVEFDRWAAIPNTECQNFGDIVLDASDMDLDDISLTQFVQDSIRNPLVGTPGERGNRKRLFLQADFSQSRLAGARFEGADLVDGSNLTQTQIDTACLDADTRLPRHLKWKGNSCPSAP